LEEIEKANKAAEEQPFENNNENKEDFSESQSFDNSSVLPVISPARIVKVEHQFNKLN